MKLQPMRTISTAIAVAAFPLMTHAQNPIVQTCYSTDPAPMVSGDRLYVFTGHDEEKADFFWMNDWRLFSTNDMVNWQDHGNPISQCDFKWADDRAWAAQCVERDGKFYLYVPIHPDQRCRRAGHVTGRHRLDPVRRIVCPAQHRPGRLCGRQAGRDLGL